MGAWELKTYNKNKTKLRKNSLFIFFLSSKCVKVATLDIQGNPIN